MIAINFFGNNPDFYPTPSRLIDKMLSGLKIEEYETILEPSAGKGDLADGIREKIKAQRYGYSGNRDSFIDVVEIDRDLRHILKGKEYTVVHDDFLKYDTQKRYDLIVMNPPFSRGEWHLAKALDLQKNGGKIVCLLNAETLKNQFSNPRRDLVRQLAEYNAEIEYISGAFADAERPTGVEIALVKVTIPEAKRSSSFFDNLNLKSEESYRARPQGQELTQAEFISNLVERYGVEVKAGIRLIEEYEAMKPQILESIDKPYSENPIIRMEVKDGKYCQSTNQLINSYVKKVRFKYWEHLFSAKEFVSRCTSNMQSDLFARIGQMANYDFSLYNIEQIKIELILGMAQAAEDTILSLFDKLSDVHAYNDFDSKNIHYFSGWKTNRSWIVGKRVIIPMYDAFSSWSGKLNLTSGPARTLEDIEKALNYLDQGGTPEGFHSLRDILALAERANCSRNIETKFFKMTFYKKGTCHLEFKNLDLLKKFNIYGSQKKGWLPPTYGKKIYAAMTEEEKSVIDSFEGEKEYLKTIQNKDYYLVENGPALLRIA